MSLFVWHGESPVSESGSYDGRLSDSSVAAVHDNPPASGGAFVPQGLAVKKFKKSWWHLELQIVTEARSGSGLQRVLVQWTLVTSRYLNELLKNNGSNNPLLDDVLEMPVPASYNDITTNSTIRYQVQDSILLNILTFCVGTMWAGPGMTLSSMSSKDGKTPGWCFGQCCVKMFQNHSMIIPTSSRLGSVHYTAMVYLNG